MSQAPSHAGLRPYLLRALHEWISDRHLTPHILVNTNHPMVRVPPHIINENGTVVLNIGHNAVRNLSLGTDEVTFNARFDVIPYRVRIPIEAILAIYSRETQEGMGFSSPEAMQGQGAMEEPTFITEADQSKSSNDMRWW